MSVPRRVYGYVRVSSEEQGKHGTSLEAQRDEIARHCRSHGWPEPVIYSEIQSGGADKLEKRVELGRLTASVEAGDVVLVAKVDRWSRDIAHGVTSVRALVKRDVRWISIGEGIDAATSQGDSMLGIMAWAADNERKRIKERTVGRRVQLRNQGCWTEATVPFGYRRDTVTRRLVIVDSDAAVVREIFERALRGHSIETIGRELRARQISREGKKPIQWDKKCVHSLLRARWYMGDIRRTSGAWEPAHPAIIDRGVFERVQKALHSRRLGGCTPRAESRTKDWLLRGLAVCGSCGARMGSAYGPSDEGRGYYACGARLRGGDCDEPYMRVSTVDESASAQTVRRLEELREILGGQKLDRAARADAGRLEALQRSLAGLKVRRERLLSIAVEGLVTQDELRARLAKLDKERGHIDAAIAEEERHVRPIDAAVRADVLREVTALRRGWLKATMAERREIFALLAERIALHNGSASIAWASPESVCEASVGKILSGPTDAKPLRKAGER